MKKEKIRILFVAMSESIHTAKWISLLSEDMYEKALFSSNIPILHNLIAHQKIKWSEPHPVLKIICKPFGKVFFRKAVSFFRIINKIIPDRNKEAKLFSTIKRFKPHIIHSMETQKAGYLVLSVKEKYFKNKRFPIWVHSNWGSDIYLFGRLDAHREKIRQILRQCDYYTCESKRDIELALKLGYKGYKFEPFPNACGFNIPSILQTRVQIKTSERRLVLIKGYQGWSGRSLFTLRAVALAAEVLHGYEIIVYSAADDDAVKISVEIMKQDLNIDIKVLENHVSNEEMLKYFAKARIYIGLSISDGISTSLLEAMAMGAFPIQSNTSTATEWIVHNEGGYIVPAEDPEIVAEYIRKAIKNDALVDEASRKNWQMIISYADSDKIKKKIDDIYSEITASIRKDIGK